MTKLPYLSALRFSGADAGDFLQRQLSADVLALEEGGASFACYCEPKGRVLALVLVCRSGGDYYLLLSAALARPVASRLKVYVMRSSLGIELLERCAVVGLHSAGTPPASAGALAVARVPGGGNWLLLTSDAAGAVADEASQDAWKAAELQRGITWLGSSTSGQFLPQMLGFEKLGAVNYRKGCYPGQEVVARAHYLGKVKRHALVLTIDRPICPRPMETVALLGAEGSGPAVVVDCCPAPGAAACLFVVTRMDPGQPVRALEYQDDKAAVLQAWATT